MNFMLKKTKIENSNFRVSYDKLKKVENFNNLTLIHFPRGQNLLDFLTGHTSQTGWNLPYFELKFLKLWDGEG